MTTGSGEAAPPPPDRPRTLTRVGLAVLWIVLAITVVGGPIIRHGVLAATDLIYLSYPWKADDLDLGPAAVRHGPLSDTVDGVLPARAVLREAAHDGDLELWDPYSGGGQPLGSVPSSGFYNPISLPYLVAPLDWAPALSKLVELCVAMGFTYLLLRRLGLSRLAATTGGVVYAASGFPTMWTGWPQSGVAAWIPAVLWATERAIAERTTRAAIPLALATAALLLGGFPAVASHALLLAGAYALVRLLRLPHDWRARAAVAARLVGAVVLGGMLAAFALLPFSGQVEGLDLRYREQSVNSHLPPDALITTLTEHAFGLASDGGYVGPSNQVETISFIGAGALVLAALALVLHSRDPARRRVHLFFAIAAVVIAVPMFFGGPLLGALQAFVPTFDVNPIGRLRAILALVVAVLAACGLDALRHAQLGRATVVRAVVVVAVLGGIFTFSALRLRDRMTPTGQLPDVKHHLLIALGIAAVVAAAAGLAIVIRSRWPAIAVGALLVVGLVVVSDSVRFAHALLPRTDRETFYPGTDSHAWLADHLGSDRFASYGLTMQPNSNSMFKLRAANGHVFHAPTWKDALLVADPKAFASSPTFSQLHDTAEVVTSPALDRLGIRYFVSPPITAPLGYLSGDTAALSTDRLAAGGRLDIEVDGPARGLVLPLAPRSGAPGRLHLEAVDEQGAVFWRSSRFFDELPAAGPAPIAIPAEDQRRWTLRLMVDGDEGLAFTAGAGEDPVARVVRPQDDGLRLVYVDDVTIYERTSALPRVRWAGESIVVPGREDRLRELSSPAADGVVVLGSGEADDEPAAGTVTIRQDGGSSIELDVVADGDGYVVVADPLQDGWIAEVDGRATTLLEADHAGVAVAVPAGEHTVALRYEPARRQAGVLLSIVAAVVVVLLLLGTSRWGETVRSKWRRAEA